VPFFANENEYFRSKENQCSIRTALTGVARSGGVLDVPWSLCSALVCTLFLQAAFFVPHEHSSQQYIRSPTWIFLRFCSYLSTTCIFAITDLQKQYFRGFSLLYFAVKTVKTIKGHIIIIMFRLYSLFYRKWQILLRTGFTIGLNRRLNQIFRSAIHRNFLHIPCRWFHSGKFPVLINL
jgi:hypothetical protein